MSSGESSRKGKRIAKRACDLCRSRKLQCTFEPTSLGELISCKRCVQVGMPCTFLTTRKLRGPPNRRVAEARAHSRSAYPSGSTNGSASTEPYLGSQMLSSIAPLSVDYLCPNETFEALISDYLNYIYPLYPLVHRPRFQQDFQSKRYQPDPTFYRRCISLSALTISCMPQSLQDYGFHPEETAASTADKAHRLILISKMSQSPAKGNQPNMNDMLCSFILSIAFHYSGKTHDGWTHASEAILCMRKLGLYRMESHKHLDRIDSEICKRVFWKMFILMTHDRIAYSAPHTGISYNPLYVDWNFLTLQEVDDLEWEHTEMTENPTVTPLIAGTIAMIKLYVCAQTLLPVPLPGNPHYGCPPSSVSLAHTSVTASSHTIDTSSGPGTHGFTLEQGLGVVQDLRNVIHQLPTELKLSNDDEQVIREPLSFIISKANIYMANLFIQSIILATLLANTTSSRPPNQGQVDPPDADISRGMNSVDDRLLDLRRNIAQEAFHIVTTIPLFALKANGVSIVSKLREITAALSTYKRDSSDLADEEEQVQCNIKRLITTLVDLDDVKETYEE